MALDSALCDSEDSVLLVIDIQTGMTALMPHDQPDRMMANAEALIETASLLQIPVLVAEHYREEFGPTEQRIVKKLPKDSPIFSKTTFACSASENFLEELGKSSRKQIIIVGQEAHLCVLQTAIELLRLGHNVFVAEDAICSRRLTHKLNALDRMCKLGVTLTNTESVAFEWLRGTTHPLYREVSNIVR